MRNLAISPSFAKVLPQGLIRLLLDIMSDRRVNIGAQQLVTIASNAFTIPTNYSHFTIAASGASTDLKNIHGGIDGDVIFCKIAATANVVVVKHSGGNLICTGSADLTFVTINDLLMCVYDGVLAKWKCDLKVMG